MVPTESGSHGGEPDLTPAWVPSLKTTAPNSAVPLEPESLLGFVSGGNYRWCGICLPTH